METTIIGNNIEEITHENANFSTWDVRGHLRIRRAWST